MIEVGNLVNELDILLLELERKLLQAFVVISLPNNCKMAIRDGYNSGGTYWINILERDLTKAATWQNCVYSLQLIILCKAWVPYFLLYRFWQIVVQHPVEISTSDLRHCVSALKGFLRALVRSYILLNHVRLVFMPVITNICAKRVFHFNALAEKLLDIQI